MGAKFKRTLAIILASIAAMLTGLCIFVIGQSLWPQSESAISDEPHVTAAQTTQPTESVLVRHHDEDAPQAASRPVSYDVTQGSDYAALYRGAPDNSLIVCAKQEDPRYPSDFQAQFDHGKIVVPKGAVFLWGGHYFGPLEDPRDDRNLAEHSDPLSWSDVDAAEQARRNDLVQKDLSITTPDAAVVTTAALTLTKNRLCGSVAARTLVSEDWKFAQATVTQADAVYYQLYGILRGDKLDTSFEHDAGPIKRAGSAGSLNAVVKGAIGNPLSLPSDTETTMGTASSDLATAVMTNSQFNAVRSAKQYLSTRSFSRAGLIQQLSADGGEGFSVADATVAVDSLTVDWNANAAEAATRYLDMRGFSCRGLIEQLSSEGGDGYTLAQAQYGAKQSGACN
ncbi:Ltp family lipoprotein [Asaia sp. VD9]|uniref:Ltp family lipoprotein n=1 Tax=Asaia sp. VD9 TaxID=3081235 RepID=UPI00301ADA8B